MSADGEQMGVLWLTPDKPEMISVGRRVIAKRLESRGYDVTLRGTTARTLLRSIREWGTYDVVVGTTRAGAIAGTVLTLGGGTASVVDHVDPVRQFESTHSRFLSLPVDWLERLAFSCADHVLYVYPEEESRVRRYASAASKTALGVDYEGFAEPSTDAVSAARSQLDARGVDRGDLLIYVGGLEPIYHINALCDSMELLSDWTLLVLGTGSLESDVRRAARERPNIQYLGTVPHEYVPGYLSLADVGLSLVDDPHTTKLLEYGAAGLPVVQLAGRAESRLDGLVTFCDGSPESIARGVRTAAGGDTQALREFVAQFDYDRITDAYQTAIDQTAAER